MSEITVKVDQGQLLKVELMLNGIRKGADRALMRALNKTVTKSKTRSSQEIRKQVNLKASYVKGKLTIKRAAISKLSARITANRRGLLLTRYGAKKVKAGVTVKVKRNGERKLLRGAFLIRLRRGSIDNAGAIGVAYREGKKPKPVKVLYGASVSQVFTDVKDKVSPEMNEYLADQLDKEIETILRGF